MQKGVVLEENFLNEVIFRIDFSTILKISGDKKEATEDFRKIIFDKYPNVEILEQKKFNDDIIIDFGNEGNLCWFFRNNDGNKEVSLTSNCLILSYKSGSYKRFHSFLEDISLLISALKEYEPFKLNFLGLRYINQIYDENINDNIDKYINPSLVNESLLTDLHEDNCELTQLISKLDYQKDKYLLTFHFGFFNPETNPNSKKHFILDYDCRNNDIKDIDDVKDNLIEMNHIIFDKFDYSITEKFRKEMGEHYDSSNY